MGNKKERSKQIDFIRIGGMLFLVLIAVLCVRMDDVVAASEDITEIYTSTESVLGKSYDELIDSLDSDIFGDYLSTLNKDSSYVIPGLDKTNIHNETICNGMIPQGICVTEEYLIISAYDKSGEMVDDSNSRSQSKQKSVLYVMDVKSQQYLTTITLNTKCHVGALAYNPDDALIYIADSVDGVVQKLSMDKIAARVETGNDAESDVLEFDEGAIDTQGYTPSFLAYYQEHLYVGQFAKVTLGDLFSNQMVVFERDGTLQKEKTITIPYYAQGVAFADWNNKTYMLISASYGRIIPAKMHVYLMDYEREGSMKHNRKIGEFACPNMSEDIDIQGDYIYTCYESASNFYRLALDKKGESTNVVDRIMVSSFRKTVAKLVTGDAERYIHRILALSKSDIRHESISMEVDDRRRLFLRLF